MAIEDKLTKITQFENPNITENPDLKLATDLLPQISYKDYGKRMEGFEVEDYSDYLGDAFNPRTDIEYRRHVRQPWHESLLGALNQAVVGEIAGGTIEGAGYLLDLPQYINLAKGTEKEFGNWFSDLGKDLKTWTQETTPIYTDPTKQGEFSPEDWTWWMSNLPSAASTISLMIPSGAAVKGATALARGLNMSAKLGRTAKWAATGLTQAVVSRHMENLMEASSTAEELGQLEGTILDEEQYKKFRSNYGIDLQPEQIDGQNYYTLTPEATSEIQAKAASNIYKADWAMLAQDIPQYLLLNTPFGKATERLSRPIAEKLGVSYIPHLAKAGKSLAADMLSEGAEEGYQFIVGERSKELALADAGLVDRRDLSDALKDYTKQGDFWTGAFFGAIGAGFMQTAGKPFNKMINRVKGIESETERRIKDIDSWKDRIKNYSGLLQVAEQSGDKDLYNEVKDYMATDMAIQSSENGNLDYMVQTLDAIANAEEGDQQLLGIDPEHVKSAKQYNPTLLKDIKETGEAYQKNLNKHGREFAGEITRNERLAIKLNDYANKRESFANKIYDTVPNIDNISNEGTELIKLRSKLTALRKTKKNVDKYISKSKDKDIKSKFQERSSELDRKIDNLDAIYQEAKKDYTGSKEDAKFSYKSKEFDAYEKELEKATSTEVIRDQYKNYYNELRTYDGQKKFSKKKADLVKKELYRAVNLAESASDISNVTNAASGTQHESTVNNAVDDRAQAQAQNDNSTPEFFSKEANKAANEVEQRNTEEITKEVEKATDEWFNRRYVDDNNKIRSALYNSDIRELKKAVNKIQNRYKSAFNSSVLNSKPTTLSTFIKFLGNRAKSENDSAAIAMLEVLNKHFSSAAKKAQGFSTQSEQSRKESKVKDSTTDAPKVTPEKPGFNRNRNALWVKSADNNAVVPTKYKSKTGEYKSALRPNEMDEGFLTSGELTLSSKLHIELNEFDEGYDPTNPDKLDANTRRYRVVYYRDGNTKNKKPANRKVIGLLPIASGSDNSTNNKGKVALKQLRSKLYKQFPPELDKGPNDKKSSISTGITTTIGGFVFTHAQEGNYTSPLKAIKKFVDSIIKNKRMPSALEKELKEVGGFFIGYSNSKGNVAFPNTSLPTISLREASAEQGSRSGELYIAIPNPAFPSDMLTLRAFKRNVSEIMKEDTKFGNQLKKDALNAIREDLEKQDNQGKVSRGISEDTVNEIKNTLVFPKKQENYLLHEVTLEDFQDVEEGRNRVTEAVEDAWLNFAKEELNNKEFNFTLKGELETGTFNELMNPYIKIGVTPNNDILSNAQALISTQFEDTKADVVKSKKVKVDKQETDIEAKKADIERRRQEEINDSGRVNLIASLNNAKNHRDSDPDSDLKGKTDSELEDIYNEGIEKINSFLSLAKDKGISSDKIAKKIISIRNNNPVLSKSKGFNNQFDKTAKNLNRILKSSEINAKYDAEVAALERQPASDKEEQQPSIVKGSKVDISTSNPVEVTKKDKGVEVKKKFKPFDIKNDTGISTKSNSIKDKMVPKKPDGEPKDFDTEDGEDTGIRLKVEKLNKAKQPLSQSEELKWIKNKLPHVDIKDLNEIQGLLHEVVKSGYEAVGAMYNAAIYLNDQVTPGTVYHEAFHVLFNYALSEKDRNALLDSVSGKTIIEKEEKLADQFADYKIAGYADKSIRGRLRKFFRQLRTLIDALVGSNITSVRQLANRADLGFYKKDIRTDRFNDTTLRTKVEGWSFEKSREAAETIANHIIVDLIPGIKEDYPELADSTDAEVLQFITNKEGQFSVFRAAQLSMSEAFNELYSLDENDLRLPLLYELINNIFNTEDGSIGPLIGETIKVLAYNHGIHMSINSVENGITEIQEEDELVGFTPDEYKENWQVEFSQRSAKDNAPTRIKNFIRYLESGEYNDFGFPKYVDYDVVYNNLLSDLEGSKNIIDLEKKLRASLMFHPEYQFFLDAMENKDFATDLLQAFSRDLYSYTVVVNKDGKYIVTESNRRGLANTIISEWSGKVLQSDIVKIDKAGNTTIDIDRSIELKDEFSRLVKKITNDNATQETYEELSEITKEFGFEIQPKVFEYVQTFDKKYLVDFYLGDQSLNTIIESFVKGSNPFDAETADDADVIKGEATSIKKIANTVKKASPELFENSFFDISGNRVYAHNVPTFLSSFVNTITDPDKVQEYLDNKKQDDFFNNGKEGVGNYILKKINNAKEDRNALKEAFKISFIDGLTEPGKKVSYADMTRADLQVLSLASYFNNNNKTYSMFRMPVFSDAGRMALARVARPKTTEQSLTELVQLADKEYNRIISLQENGGNGIKNYDSDVNKSLKSGFHIMSMLNGKVKKAPGKDFNNIKKELDSYFTDLAEKYYKSLIENKVVVETKKGFDTDNSRIDKRILANKTQESFKKYLKEFLINDFLVRSSTSLLTVGDPAFYSYKDGSTTVDYTKRAKEIISPKLIPDDTAVYEVKDSEGNVTDIIRVDSEYRTVYLNDAEIGSPNNEAIISAVDNLEKEGIISKTKADQLRVAYSSKEGTIEQTDGQAYITLPFFRETMISLNRWKDKHQKAYNRLMDGKGTANDIALMFQPIKPFVYTQVYNSDLKRYVPVQHKNSEFLLLPQLANKNLQLKKLHDYMVEKGVGVANFNSAVKVGGFGSVNLDVLEEETVKEWSRYSDNGYEVSTQGDSRFSALNATFNNGTIIEGIDVSGMTIEKVYQSVIKKSSKGAKPSKESILYNTDLTSKEALEDFSYERGYLPLWKKWSKQNPTLIKELSDKSKDKVLTDKFANTKVSQARALAEIIKEYNQPVIHNIPMADRGVQQETPEHTIDTENRFGTQIRKLIMSDLYDGTTYFGGKNPQELYDLYESLIIQDLKEAYEAVEEKFTDEDGNVNYTKLHAILLDEARKRGKGDEFEKAIELITDENGNKRMQLPLFHPLFANTTESLITSVFRNNITNQKINGAAVVQASNFGLSENLKLVFDTEENRQEFEKDVMSYKDWGNSIIGRISYNNQVLRKSQIEETNLIVDDLISGELKVASFAAEDINNKQYADFIKRLTDNGFKQVEGQEWLFTKDGITPEKLYEEYKESTSIQKSTQLRPKAKGLLYAEIMLPAWSKEFFQDFIDEDGNVDFDKAKASLPEEVFEMIGYRIPTEDKYSMLPLKVVGFLPVESGGAVMLPAEITKISGSDFDIDKMFIMMKSFKRNEDGKYTVDQYDETKGPEGNSRSARDNMKIDLMMSVLRNPHTLEAILTPGGFEYNREVASIMRNKLGVEASLPNLFDIMTQDEMAIRNMTGKKLVGIAANHNAHHALRQHFNLSLIEGLKFDEKEYDKLGNRNADKEWKYNKDTNKLEEVEGTTRTISRNLSEFLAAVVDNAKDPLASFMNYNEYTADIISLLIGAGIDTHTAVFFVNQPIIREVLEEQRSNPDKYIGSIVKKVAKKYNIKLKRNLPNLNTQDLFDNIDKTVTANFGLQAEVLVAFSKYQKYAKDLGEVIRASTSDTKGLGASMAHGESITKLQEKITDPGRIFSIQGVNEMFEETEKNNFVAGFTKYGIKDPITNVMEKIYPYNNYLFDTVKSRINNQLETRELSPKERNFINRQLVSFLISKFDFFDISEKDTIINKMPSRLIEMREKYGDRFNNPFTLRLNYETSSDRMPIDFINFNNVSKLSEGQRVRIQESWADMLNPDITPEEDIRKFAQDLIQYSFYTSGLSFTPNSFSNMIPVDAYISLIKDSKGLTLSDIMYMDLEAYSTSNGLNTGMGDMIYTFLNQFYRNNSNNSVYVPTLNEDKSNFTYKTESEIGVNPDKVSDENLFRTDQIIGEEGPTKVYIGKEFISDKTKVGIKLYKFSHFDNNRGMLIYTRTTPLGIPNYIIEYNRNGGTEMESVIETNNKLDNNRKPTVVQKQGEETTETTDNPSESIPDIDDVPSQEEIEEMKKICPSPSDQTITDL